MPLKKATQAVIAPNICTTDTNQTITGSKTFTQTIAGNVSTATTLQTGRTIAISGAVTGTATSFNGGANIVIPATITSGASIPSPAFTGTATGTLTSNVIQGVTDGSNAPAGVVGQIIQSTPATAASIATGATVTGATITLTAGDWNIDGSVTFNFSGTTVTANTTIAAGISTTAALISDQQQLFLLPAYTTATATPAFAITVPVTRQNVSSNTPVNIIVKAPSFTAGTITYTSFIKARRIR
jgi:hypothetical protein